MKKAMTILIFLWSKEMKLFQKFSAALLLSAFATGSAFAGGHMKAWEASGTQIPVSSETKTGKSGSITHLISTDIWDNSKAPANIPRVVKATCHNTVVNDSNGAMLGGVGVCESVDGDGDVSLYIGTFGRDGVYSATLSQGTGKYKDYVGVKLTGGFIGQTSSGEGIYHMKPQ